MAVPALVADLGERGTRAAIVLSAGLEAKGPGGSTLRDAMLQAARPHALRILGPNCIGFLAPGIGLNASFAHLNPNPGSIAFIAQSGALTTAMIDWAQSAGVGFSCCVSLGNAADVDFGDLLDYLGRDPQTRAILLYIEAIGAGEIRATRKFMSAARAPRARSDIAADPTRRYRALPALPGTDRSGGYVHALLLQCEGISRGRTGAFHADRLRP
jgi:acetyltransferase